MKAIVFKLRDKWILKFTNNDRTTISDRKVITWLDENVKNPRNDTEVEFTSKQNMQDIKLTNPKRDDKVKRAENENIPHRNPNNDQLFARSPYNFTPLNEKVAFLSKEEDRIFDKFDSTKKSGFITLSVTNLTPLFLRQISDNHDNFGYGGNYGIPGSSMRGMLRTIAEIISFGYFGNHDDTTLYKRANNRAGNLEMKSGTIEWDGEFYVIKKCNFRRNPGYENSKVNPIFNIDGFYFTTGAFGGERFSKFYFNNFENDISFSISKSDKIYKNYMNDVNRSMETYNIFDEAHKGRFPIFYQENNNVITSIGFAKYHRVPFNKSISDHILPREINKSKSLNNADLVQGLFGDSFDEKNTDGCNMIASRIAFGDLMIAGKYEVYNISELLKILASPKPTSHQHYLEQGANATTASKNWNSENAPLRGFKLYWHKGTKDNGEVDLRWNENWSEDRDNQLNSATNKRYKTDSHAERVKPIKPDANFDGKIWFNNLTDLELGLLLSALEPFADKNNEIAHKIGIGKSLGLGSIKIKIKDLNIITTEKTSEYWSSFSSKPNSNEEEIKKAKIYYDNSIGRVINKNSKSIWEETRLKELRTMMTFDNQIVSGDVRLQKTRYMEIERGHDDKNEYFRKRILPRPSQVKNFSINNFVNGDINQL